MRQTVRRPWPSFVAAITLAMLFAGCRSKPTPATVLSDAEAHYPPPATETRSGTAFHGTPEALATPAQGPTARATLNTTPWPTFAPLPTVDGGKPIYIRPVYRFGDQGAGRGPYLDRGELPWWFPPRAVLIGNTLWTVENVPHGEVGTARSILKAWNVSASAPPVALGMHSSALAVDALATDGDYIFLIGNELGDVSVVDVRDPRHPAEVATMERSAARIAHCLEERYNGCAPSGTGSVVAAHGKLLIGYVRGGLEIIDVRDPAHPLEQGFVRVSDVIGLAAAGETAWVIPDTEEYTLLKAVDLTRLANDDEAVKDVGGPDLSEGRCVTSSGNRAYYTEMVRFVGGRAELAPTTFKVLDRDSDGSVRVTGGLTLTLGLDRDEFPECTLVVDEGLAVLHVTTHDEHNPDLLFIVDVSDPTRPAVRGAYRGDHWPVPFAIRDRTLFGLSSSGLTRWAISGP